MLHVACFDGSPLFTSLGAPCLWLSSSDVGEEEEAAEATKTFQDLMGSDVEARRTFIEKNAKFVVNLDI